MRMVYPTDRQTGSHTERYEKREKRRKTSIRETEGHAAKTTDRQAGRQTDRYTFRETDKRPKNIGPPQERKANRQNKNKTGIQIGR